VKGFSAAAEKIKTKHVHVIGLGCGGGQKDARLLKLLGARGGESFYTPCDVSTAMVLVARQTALKVLPEENCFPFVCDLATTNDLSAIFNSRGTQHATRIITFFGMIPNFEPREILPRIASLIRPGDFLLFSANLAPGQDYTAGMKRILPQYDNTPTRDWLMTLLLDLGIERRDGELRFEIAFGGFGLKRFVANFHFKRARQIAVEDRTFNFKRGDAIRLFFSYRYTPQHVEKILSKFNLKVSQSWIANSGEEGVFLVRRI
jgi:L-histidine Nalpha-methyltransferase